MRRDWTDAIEAHQGERCAVCHAGPRLLLANPELPGTRLELAHTIGRKYDLPAKAGEIRRVDPLAVITLCGPQVNTGTCHNRYDSHQLDIRPYLTDAQLQWAINRIGHGPAMRALAGRNWT